MTVYLSNRKATFDYEILETFEAGIVLSGHEVKAVRAGRGKLDGGFIKVYGKQAMLVGVSISAYQPANTPKNYDPERARALLIHQKELAHLRQQLDTARLTAIPLRLYNSGRHIKLVFALVRGKKKYDKRESLKERDTKRDIERTLKTQ
jgi:SsrA-binding protein